MKKHTHFFTIIGLIALMFSTPAFGQGYQSFFGEKTTKYHIFLHWPSCNGHKSDSVIHGILGGGNTWNLLISKENTAMISDTVYYWDNWRGMYIREDTSTGQIFRYIKENKKEYLICDMSLNIGDTFTLPDWSSEEYKEWYYEAGENIIVDSISYINGKKVIYFSSIENSMYFDTWLYPPWHPWHIYEKLYHLAFIEGIGPVYGPFGYIDLGWGNLGILLCVEKDDTLTYMTSSYLGCFQVAGGSITDIEINPIRVYPNPATDNIHIEIDNEALLYGTLRIIDPIGQIVLTRTLTSNKETISVKHLSAGIYIIHYNFNNQIFHSKIVKY